MDISLFKHRCLCISLAFMTFFNAFGTWFWYSMIRTTKLLNRLHVTLLVSLNSIGFHWIFIFHFIFQKVVVYLILNIALLATHFSYKSNYIPKVRGYFDQKIFFDEIARMQTSFVIVILIIILSLAIIGINLNHIRHRIKYMMRKKKRNRH